MSPMPSWRSTGTANSSGCLTNLYGPLLAGVYTTPAICCEVKVVFTNTVPADAYRGVGRPEATFVLERLIDVRGARYRHRSSRNSAAQLVMRWEGIPAGLLTTVAACGLLSGSGVSICIEKHHG
jgi:Molybdopterin-binding domain of aldehyde dehydrogenase